MKAEINELENLITSSLIEINKLNNLVDQKELEKQDQIKEFALSIIDVLDSFENIEEILIERQMDKIEDVTKTMRRYQSIQRKLLLILKKNGVSKIEFPDNRLILGVCEVLETIPDKVRQNDEIISVIRNGYMRGGDLIRAAEVIIVKN